MHRETEAVMCLVSAALIAATLVATPRLIRRLPEDYLVRDPPKRPWPTRLAINACALAVIALGVAMLILPGPGIVTVLIGVALLDLPVRRRALAWIVRRPKVERLVQTLRARGGQPPLEVPA
jgi:hypothetical protein